MEQKFSKEILLGFKNWIQEFEVCRELLLINLLAARLLQVKVFIKSGIFQIIQNSCQQEPDHNIASQNKALNRFKNIYPCKFNKIIFPKPLTKKSYVNYYYLVNSFTIFTRRKLNYDFLLIICF